LKGDAAKTICIAAGRGGKGTLPSPEEDVLGGEAPIFQGASRKLAKEAILRILTQRKIDLLS